MSLRHGARSLQAWADLFWNLSQMRSDPSSKECFKGCKGPGSQAFPKQGLGTLKQQDKQAMVDQSQKPLEADLPDSLDLMVISEVIVYNRHCTFFAGIITIVCCFISQQKQVVFVDIQGKTA